MDTIRAIIVDDEPLARENLTIRLQANDEFIIVGECANGQEAIDMIQAEKPDLVFLDIQMPDRNGFDVLEEIDPDIMPVVVFVTAYDRYALDAFRVHALDYLLKPFDDDRFAETLQYARETVAEIRKNQSEADSVTAPIAQDQPGELAGRDGRQDGGKYWDRLIIKMRGRVFFLKTDNVEWIEAHGDYARLYSGSKNYLIRKTMNEMEQRLDPSCFARISRSSIIHLDRVVELKPISRGEFMIRLLSGSEMKLTRTYREKLEKLLGDRL
jgi:two-component system, LytTR family, response regulator